MTYVNDYERWFCEVCWYYAPHDFLRPIGGGEEKDSTVKVRKRPTGRKVNNRKWNSKKISELPLFKKKRDRRK